MQLLRKIFTLLFLCAFVFFIFKSFSKYYLEVINYSLVPPLLNIGEGLLLFIIWIFAYSYCWEWILFTTCNINSAKIRLTVKAIFLKGMLARYIPGKVWQFGVMVHELSKLGVKYEATILSIFFQHANLIGATLLLFLIMAPAFLIKFNNLVWTVYLFMAVSLVAVSFWVLFPQTVFRIIARMPLKTLQLDKDVFTNRENIKNWRFTFFLFLMISIMQGLIMFPIIEGLVNVELTFYDWLAILFAYPISRLIGQLAIITPGGLGVREGAYVFLTMPFIDVGLSTIIVIWARLLSISAELTAYLITSIATKVKVK